MNISNPLVSIFILCYNHEKYVAEAIESVINQTYKNIEIIIVDNASTDNSRAIIESCAMKDERIKFSPIEYNSFASAGFNFAIKQCSGEYICGLSADDYFELNKVEIQLEYMLSNKLSNTFTWVKVINDNNEELFGHLADDLFNRHFLPNEIEKIFITQGNTVCAVTLMFHKSIFEKYGYFDHRLLQTQDFDLWLRISKNEKINLLTEKLTCYRVRDDGNNLSLFMDKRATLRSWFEITYCIRRVLDFNIHLISEIIGIECSEETKYINLFKYYMTKNLVPHAIAILYEMYEKLGPDFQFPSQCYNDFFEIHSTFDFMGAFEDKRLNLNIQLYIENGKGITEENSIKLTVLESNQIQKFEFDLRNNKNIKSLRLDPLSDSCIIEIKELYLLLENQEKIDLIPYISANACSYYKNNYFFDSFDPQIYFKDFDIKCLDSIEKLCIELKYNYISKDAIHKCVDQILIDKNYNISILENEKINLKSRVSDLENEKIDLNNRVSDLENEKIDLNNRVLDLENEKINLKSRVSDLENELILIYTSNSWKITRLFRNIIKKFKKR